MPADRGLLAFVGALVAGLDAGDPTAASRVRALAGTRTARIGLDDESVDVRFAADGSFHATSVGEGAAPCRGRTDRRTVHDLLDARLEIRDAVLSGRIEAVGPVPDVAAMFAVVEVLLAASVRLPALQSLADELLGVPPAPGAPTRADLAWYPDEITPAERALLADLDLLADETGPVG